MQAARVRFCGFCAERGKARADTVPASLWGGRERECVEQQKLRGVEYRCGRAGGPVRSSEEAAGMTVERRGWLIHVLSTRATGRWPGRRRVNKSSPK